MTRTVLVLAGALLLSLPGCQQTQQPAPARPIIVIPPRPCPPPRGPKIIIRPVIVPHREPCPQPCPAPCPAPHRPNCPHPPAPHHPHGQLPAN